MKTRTLMCAVIVSGLSAGVSHATITANNSIINSPAGITQNNWTIDTDSDFLSAVVLVELTAGTVHDPTTFLGFGVDGELVAPGNGDTFVTANGNIPAVLAGDQGCLSLGCGSTPAVIEPTLIDIGWGSPGADTDDIGTGLPVGRFSFTDDAVGTWSLQVNNQGGDQPVFSGVVINGAMVPEPATLGLLTLGGFALLQKHRR